MSGCADTGAVTGTYAYTPYRFNTTITGTAGSVNRLRRLGSYQLASSEYLTGYRHYSPVYARFTQPDPTSHEANAYAYGVGDPVNHSDPEGSKITLAGVLGAVGGVVGSGFGLGIGAYAAAAGVATGGVGIALGIGIAAVCGAVGAGIGTGVGGSSDEVTTNAGLDLASGLSYFIS